MNERIEALMERIEMLLEDNIFHIEQTHHNNNELDQLNEELSFLEHNNE